MRPAIKICGLTRPEDAALAGSLGAAYVGAIFADGPRRISAEQARRIFAAAPRARGVCVFGDSDPGVIADAAAAAGASVVQLHGHPSAESMSAVRGEFPGEVWVVVRVGDALSIPEWVSESADAVVLDTADAVRQGGTGRSFGWAMAAQALENDTRPRKLVLAGGLRPSNVGEAVRQLHPDVLDVSSGVESSPGIKDPALLSAFVEAVRRSDDR